MPLTISRQIDYANQVLKIKSPLEYMMMLQVTPQNPSKNSNNSHFVETEKRSSNYPE